MKKIHVALVLSFVFVALGSVALVPGASAALEYPLLEKIPLTNITNGSDFPGYLSAVYKLALVVVTLSAVFMLSVGGFMYLTSAGNTSSISTAKGIIADSLIGLVIALTAWLLLYIINPDLVEITLNLNGLPAVSSPNAPPAAPGAVGNLPPQDSVVLAQQILANNNISWFPSGSCGLGAGNPVTPKKNMESIAAGKKSAKCSNGCTATSGCVEDAVTLSNTMLKAIWTVGQTKSFTINSISGGSHASKSPHYAGQAIDIIAPINQSIMDAFVKANAITPAAPPTDAACQVAGGIACGQGRGASMCENPNGLNVGCAPGSGANHIHFLFPG